MKSFLITLLIFCLSSGCREKEVKGSVEIRVYNASSFDYTNVVVNTSGGEHNYGSIASKTYSSYRTYEYAYQYAYVELLIGDKKYFLQPIDYVGEKKLKSGKYTYKINNESEDSSLTFEFETD